MIKLAEEQAGHGRMHGATVKDSSNNSESYDVIPFFALRLHQPANHPTTHADERTLASSIPSLRVLLPQINSQGPARWEWEEGSRSSFFAGGSLDLQPYQMVSEQLKKRY
jgi:hypothetical protein